MTATTPKRPGKKRAERMAKALKLREAGSTYEQIGNILNISLTQAHRDVTDALHLTIQEPADQLRETEARRLDTLMRSLWRKATDTDSPQQLGAIDRIIRIQERRAKLLGLDTQGGDIGTQEVSNMLTQLLGQDPTR